jgi:hypothetical protein
VNARLSAQVKVFAYLVSAAMLALVLSPLFGRPPVDSFPLSTYPMFSQGRRDAIVTVERAVGLSPRGARALPPRLVGSEEVLQAKMTISQTVARGKQAASALCREIAARVARNKAFDDVVGVEIRTDVFDALAPSAGRGEPITSTVHATCKVNP